MNVIERGIDPGEQFDTGKVESVVETGSQVVRLNFIGSFDFRTPISVIRKYRDIIKAYSQKGIKVLGLVGAQSVKDGYDPANPEPFADKLAAATSKIVHFFGSKLEGLEIFNEPNDFMGGDTHQVTPETMALFLTKASDAASARRQKRKLRLVSGPLFSHDLSESVWEDSAARYFYDLLYAGFNTHGWTHDTLPFDEIGYHIYVRQGSSDSTTVTNGIVQNLEEIEWVLGEFNINSSLSVSEIGWQSEIVGEERQASNITVTHDVLTGDPQVGRWLYFTLNDFVGYTWGVVDPDGRKKPGFAALASLPK